MLCGKWIKKYMIVLWNLVDRNQCEIRTKKVGSFRLPNIIFLTLVKLFIKTAKLNISFSLVRANQIKYLHVFNISFDNKENLYIFK